MAFQFPAPIQVEIHLKKIEVRLARFLSQRAGVWGMIAVGLGLAWIIFHSAYFFVFVDQARANGGFRVIRLLKYSLPFFLVASLAPIILQRDLKNFSFYTLFLAWFINVHFYFHRLPVGLALLVHAVYPVGVIGGLYFARLRESRKSPFVYLFLFAYATLLIYIGYSLYHFRIGYFLSFWQFKIHYLFFQIILIYFFFYPRKDLPDLMLAPTFVARGLVLPETSRRETSDKERRFLWWNGILNILVGLAIAFVRLGFEEVLRGFKSIYIVYPGRYFLAVLGIISFLNILSGLLRLYSFSILDATNFFWLARSPSEYWRRGSVYSYILLKKFIYLPLLSRLKMPRLSRFFTFFIFINIKIGFINYLALALSLIGYKLFNEFATYTREIYAMMHWTLWFLLLEFSRPFFTRTALKEKAGRAWLSIAMTHASMASLYLITYLVYHKVMK